LDVGKVGTDFLKIFTTQHGERSAHICLTDGYTAQN